MPYTYLAATRDPTLTTADIHGASCIYLFRTRSGRHGRARLYGVPFSRRACRRLRRVRMLRACPANRQPILRQKKYQDMSVAQTLLASGTDRPETCHQTCSIGFKALLPSSFAGIWRIVAWRCSGSEGDASGSTQASSTSDCPRAPVLAVGVEVVGAHSKRPGCNVGRSRSLARCAALSARGLRYLAWWARQPSRMRAPSKHFPCAPPFVQIPHPGNQAAEQGSSCLD